MWVSNLGSESLRNPVVWAACSRLLCCEESLPCSIKSPSQDRNTFLLASLSPDGEPRVFEFKVVQNQMKKGGVQKNYNSWVVIH